MAVGVGAAGKKKYLSCAVGHGTSDRQKLEESEPENIHIAINPRWALGGSTDINETHAAASSYFWRSAERQCILGWDSHFLAVLKWAPCWESNLEGGGWLPETDAESNLSHAQFPQEGPGGGDCLRLCVWTGRRKRDSQTWYSRPEHCSFLWIGLHGRSCSSKIIKILLI